MDRIRQGDILRVGGLEFPVMVVSNDFFNGSGKAIVCPILENAAEGPLHIRLRDCSEEGSVLCEQVRFVDLTARRYVRLSSAPYYDTMDISDAVMSIFDYQIL